MQRIVIAVLLSACAAQLSPATEWRDLPSTAVNVDGDYLALIGDVGGRQLAFAIADGSVTAYGVTGTTPRWTYPIPAGATARGLGDITGDGYPEVMVLVATPPLITCANGELATSRTLVVISGASGTPIYQSDPIQDVCVSNDGAPARPVPAMQFGAVAAGGTVLAIAPQHYPTARLVTPTLATHVYTAETAAFAAYSVAKPMLQPWARGQPYATDQRPFNGIVVASSYGDRYIAATSGRFAQFAIADYGSQQLLVDSPFLARPDLVGRTDGLLLHDSAGNPDNLFLVSGTSSADLLDDILQANASNVVVGTDVQAGVERHISRLHIPDGDVSQRFVGSLHDSHDGNAYVGRVTYPSRALLPSQDAAGSRVIYNELDGNTWSIHISNPGGIVSAEIIANHYVWDAYERDADTVELLVSAVDTDRSVQVPATLDADGHVAAWRPATYFTTPQTKVWRWTRAKESVVELATIDGIPDLVRVAPTRNPTTSAGYLRRALFVDDAGELTLVMRDVTGTRFLAAVTW